MLPLFLCHAFLIAVETSIVNAVFWCNSECVEFNNELVKKLQREQNEVTWSFASDQASLASETLIKALTKQEITVRGFYAESNKSVSEMPALIADVSNAFLTDIEENLEDGESAVYFACFYMKDTDVKGIKVSNVKEIATASENDYIDYNATFEGFESEDEAARLVDELKSAGSLDTEEMPGNDNFEDKVRAEFKSQTAFACVY